LIYGTDAENSFVCRWVHIPIIPAIACRSDRQYSKFVVQVSKKIFFEPVVVASSQTGVDDVGTPIFAQSGGSNQIGTIGGSIRKTIEISVVVKYSDNIRFRCRSDPYNANSIVRGCNGTGYVGAVTLAILASKNTDPQAAGLYMGAQLAGGIVAAISGRRRRRIIGWYHSLVSFCCSIGLIVS